MENRTETYDGKGNLLSLVDTRTLAGEKARRIAALKAATGEAILAIYPVYKQSNAALGVYSKQETQAIKEGIQTLRMACDAREALMSACKTLEELDAL